MSPEEDVMKRWVEVDGDKVGFEGESGEGTTVDTDEPFTLRIRYLVSNISFYNYYMVFVFI